MLKRPHYLALAIVVLFVLVVLNLTSQRSARLKLALGGLFLPLFGLAGSATRLSEQAGNAVVPRKVLASRVEELSRENEQLRLHALQDEETRSENQRLRKLLAFQQQTPWKVKLARVVGRDPANWWRTLRIDLGARDGVRTNAPVLAPEGLVGRVSEVGLGYSQVVLVGDPNCRVSALIQETREHGILSAASGLLDPSLVDLTFIARNSPIQPEQKVSTCGLAGIFPKGIPIGKIVDWRSGQFDLYLEARVKLAVNLGRLEEVWVMLP